MRGWVWKSFLHDVVVCDIHDKPDKPHLFWSCLAKPPIQAGVLQVIYGNATPTWA